MSELTIEDARFFEANDKLLSIGFTECSYYNKEQTADINNHTYQLHSIGPGEDALSKDIKEK